MKKKLISLAALLILSCMMLTSCITQMFGDMGITQKPETTQRPDLGGLQNPTETEPAKSGCGSVISMGLVSLIALAATAVCVKRKD